MKTLVKLCSQRKGWWKNCEWMFPERTVLIFVMAQQSVTLSGLLVISYLPSLYVLQCQFAHVACWSSAWTDWLSKVHESRTDLLLDCHYSSCYKISNHQPLPQAWNLIFGRRLICRWLESSTGSPEVESFIQNQNHVTRNFLSESQIRDNYKRRLKSIWNVPKYGCPERYRWADLLWFALIR